ncbi:MAG: hypothetical protein JWQ38_1240, partial [Flavipsychrobacter sp.]|nr:hypothetical protein [Flavipsychrobacter sp.]
CAVAQYTDMQQQAYTPAEEYLRQQLTDQVMQQMNRIDWAHLEHKESAGSVLYTIPVVVHVLHNYGPELISDDAVYNYIAGINNLLLKTTPDTINIIDKYKPVAANTQIALKLATKDPAGYPTKGIEHITSYLTNYNSPVRDQLKIGQWPQEKYLNIWIINSYTAPAIDLYGSAYTPFKAAYYPYYDGIFTTYNLMRERAGGAWLTAKYLNLPYPCNYSPPCNDADGIPDTPPCYNDFFSACSHIYDITCDTPNRQNVMYGYDTCSIMFTYGQAKYMQYVLQINMGNRDNLNKPANISATGADQPMPDLLPVPDFSIKNILNQPTYFFSQGQEVRFANTSWNDTVIAASWTFSNDATIPTSTTLTSVVNHFHQPGWVGVTITAAGNNTGAVSMTKPQALYIADSVSTIVTDGYKEEFMPRGDIYKWPTFNYFNNIFKWELSNAGYNDRYSMSYLGYDSRSFPEKYTGTPKGDMDDMFTPRFDLSGFTGMCYLNFMSTSATIATKTYDMTSALEIDYSTDLSVTWHPLKIIKGSELANKGTISTPYTPSSASDWVARAIVIPVEIRTNHTMFRFRYQPGADSTGFSTGNNFYIDNINFNSWPEDVAVVTANGMGATVYPNPTHNGAAVIISSDHYINIAGIIVTDMAGREVYKTEQPVNGYKGSIAIPAATIAASGLYLVHIVTDRINRTEKLTVY